MISEVDIRDWGSSPVKPITSKDQYEHYLKNHDWSYEFSDDQLIWRAGRMTRAYLMEARGFFDPDHSTWDRYVK